MNPPIIKILQPGDEAALEAFLLPRLDASMFLISNLRTAGLRDTGHRLWGIYAAAFAHGRIVSVVAHYRIGALVCQAPLYLEALWRAVVAASGWGVVRVIGPVAQVGLVRAALPISERDVQMDETEGLYSLLLADLIEPTAVRTDQVMGRRMTARDLDQVAAWRADYAIEALGDADTPELHSQCRAAAERVLADGTTWVLEDRGELVAMSSFNSTIAEAVQIGGVWTPPALRGRGYGRAVVAASLRDAGVEGVSKAILFTGDSNISAQKAYLALGFRRIGDYRLLLLRTPVTVPYSPSLQDDLLRIGRDCAALPVMDPRTPEETLGYNEHGTPS